MAAKKKDYEENVPLIEQHHKTVRRATEEYDEHIRCSSPPPPPKTNKHQQRQYHKHIRPATSTSVQSVPAALLTLPQGRALRGGGVHQGRPTQATFAARGAASCMQQLPVRQCCRASAEMRGALQAAGHHRG